MADVTKYVKLKRSDTFGFGFSILGGAGSQLPPIVYDIIEGSPAAKSHQLFPGDIIWEVNGKEVHSFTTKEVLHCLRISSSEVTLKLKTESAFRNKINNLLNQSTNKDFLLHAITQNDLQGVKHVRAKNLCTLDTSEKNCTANLRESCDSKENDCFLVSTKGAHSEENGVKGYTGENGVVCQSENLSMTCKLIHDSSRTSPDPCWHPNLRPLNDIKYSGSLSMPTSPNESEMSGLRITNRLELRSPVSLCSQTLTPTNTALPFTCPTKNLSVRMSKSEDHLQYQKESMSSVNVDFDEDVNSSLNTLLNTRDESSTPSPPVFPYPCVITNSSNSDDDPHIIWSFNAPLASPTDTSIHSSHDSDSPLLHSSPISPQSPTSSVQYSCSAVYDKMCNARDSHGSSNRSDNMCSNSSSLTSPDTDVPDELEWDDTTPTFMPSTNNHINGYNDIRDAIAKVPNGHFRRPSSPTDTSSISDKPNQRDENRIVIKVAGPDKALSKAKSSQQHHSKRPNLLNPKDCNGDPDRTPTNTPPLTPGSGTMSPETLAYQQLWESEDEATCQSERSEGGHSKRLSPPCPKTFVSPPASEDESDIESLHSFHYSPKAVDLPSALRLAKRLYQLDGFKKSDVSRHLSKK